MNTKYILYQTTNLVNGKIYIGIHQTIDVDDGYLGSGKLLKSAIRKYGKENFKRDILAIVDSVEELELLEAQVVTDWFCERADTYNLMPGGKWGSKERNNLTFEGRQHSEESIAKMCNQPRVFSELSKEKMRENSFSKTEPERQREHARSAGKIGGSKPKSPEHKAKIAAAVKAAHEKRRKEKQELDGV